MKQGFCHINRCYFVARMWVNADMANLFQHPSADDDWELHEGLYDITWFNGPQLPESLVLEEQTTSVKTQTMSKTSAFHHQMKTSYTLMMNSSDKRCLSGIWTLT